MMVARGFIPREFVRPVKAERVNDFETPTVSI